MALDAEPSVDPKLLGELIDKRVKEKTKNLEATVTKLQQQLQRQPKDQRGAKNLTKKDNKNPGASAKNKSKKQQKDNKKPTTKKGKDSAAEDGNDSKCGNGKYKKKKTGGKKRGTSNDSKTSGKK